MLLKSKNYFKAESNFFSKLSAVNDNNDHSHEFIEIFYVVSGSAYHTLNGIKSKIVPGDIYIIRLTDSHHFSKIDFTATFLLKKTPLNPFALLYPMIFTKKF